MIQGSRRGMVAKLADDVRRVALLVPKALIAKVDRWRRHQEDVPNQSEAIRRLIEAGLAATEKPKGKA
jgi:metal-responsive CopG/Arc/MetJ family transcriptional regulator